MSVPEGWGLFGFFYRLDGYQAHRYVQAEDGERPLDWRPRLARWLVDQTRQARRNRRTEREGCDCRNPSCAYKNGRGSMPDAGSGS